jgi:catechol 2,3-dioxygenase-like lactoylglutathione lyase family enzyme
MPNVWEAGPPAVQFRIARPTDQLDAVVRFYHDGLGLPIIDSFGGEGHKGYTGVMLGLPGHDYHLEFTQHDDGSPCPAPTEDNLLVFYIPDRAVIDQIAAHLAELGHPAVPPENPYWEGRGVTVADPDGWRVVLMNTEGI